MSSHRRHLVAVGALLALAGCLSPASTTRDAARPLVPEPERIRRDVAYLASDALEGRATGTPGNDSAAAYIARRFRDLGLRPAGGASAGAATVESYYLPFTARSIANAHAGLAAELPTRNVAAVVPGSDATLRSQYVIIGAHFDHLGRSAANALDPEAGDAIRNGADDNASGTAAVLELARLFAARPARRSLLFVAFSGEELGLLGSQHFVDHSPVPLDQVQAMLNFDMVGRLRDSRLLVYGVATAAELTAVVDSANTSGPAALGAGRAGASASSPLSITRIGDGFGPSDQSSFYGRGVPVLHLFTDLHDDYHRATDDADKVDVAGEARVIAFAERVARNLADRPTRLAVVRSAAPVLGGGQREGPRVYLGSVPDMSAADVAGLRLTGVRPGSPADRAGLRAGDVVVELGGVAVKDLYGYSDALYSHHPGDTVSIVVLRNGERVTLTAVLGSR